MNENEQLVHEIQARIAQLQELSGTDLKTEMDDLKVVLLKNPVACQLLLLLDQENNGFTILKVTATRKAVIRVRKLLAVNLEEL